VRRYPRSYICQLRDYVKLPIILFVRSRRGRRWRTILRPIISVEQTSPTQKLFEHNALSSRVISVDDESAVIYPVRVPGEECSTFEPSDARQPDSKIFSNNYGDAVLFENPGPA